jgi:hypothetical protein
MKLNEGERDGSIKIIFGPRAYVTYGSESTQ